MGWKRPISVRRNGGVMDTNAGHGRYGYSALPDRPVYDWPEGKRLAVYIGLNLETFASGCGPPGASSAPSPVPKSKVSRLSAT